MKSFGSEFNGMFLVVIDGYKVKKAFTRKVPAYRWCLRYSVNGNNYIELWYQNSEGSASLLMYFN